MHLLKDVFKRIPRPFAIGGNEQANQNQVSITVQTRFQYASSEGPYGIKVFQLASHMIPQKIQSMANWKQQPKPYHRLLTISFNDAVSNW